MAASPILPRQECTICGLGVTTCPDRARPGFTICVNPRWDDNYCGSFCACKKCDPGTNCIGGVCGTCPAGQTICHDYITSYCTDLQTSPRDCGKCGAEVMSRGIRADTSATPASARAASASL